MSDSQINKISCTDLMLKKALASLKIDKKTQEALRKKKRRNRPVCPILAQKYLKRIENGFRTTGRPRNSLLRWNQEMEDIYQNLDNLDINAFLNAGKHRNLNPSFYKQILAGFYSKKKRKDLEALSKSWNENLLRQKKLSLEAEQKQ